MLASMLLPVAFASLCASATGQGLPLPLASPMAAMAVAASVVCWRRLAQVWHRTPPGDDDQGWPRRWWSEDRPLGPSGGPGGITFDWYTFEREFRAYLGERQGASEREPVAH